MIDEELRRLRVEEAEQERIAYNEYCAAEARKQAEIDHERYLQDKQYYDENNHL